MSDDRYQQPRTTSDAGSEILPVSERLYNKTVKLQREDAAKQSRATKEERLKNRRKTSQKNFDRTTYMLRQAAVDKYGPGVLDGNSRLRAKGLSFDNSPNAKRPK